MQSILICPGHIKIGNKEIIIKFDHNTNSDPWYHLLQIQKSASLRGVAIRLYDSWM